MEFDVLKIQENSTTVKAEGNSIVSHKKSSIERVGFRRFENGRVYQSSRLGDASIDVLISESKTFGGPGSAQEFDFSTARTLHKESSFTEEGSLSSYQEALNFLVHKYPNFVFSGQCANLDKRASLSSSYGLSLSSGGGLIEWYFLYQRKGSGNMLDGYIFGSSPEDRIFESVKQQEMFITDSEKPLDIKNGRFPVLMVDEKPVLKKLLESIHINKYKENAALYSNKLGEKLFSEKVNLVDVGYCPQFGQNLFFDGEGVVREEDLFLVREGKFSSLISDLRYEKKYGYKSTGNGTRLYNRGVNLDFKKLEIKEGKRSWKDILSDLPFCVVALVSAGGDSNDLGEYSAPVQVGYIFKNGQLAGLCPQITVKTSVDQFLGDKLIDISSDGFTKDLSSACVISEMDIFVN